MAYQRDPLSVRYDASAGRLLGRAYAQPGSWIYHNVRRPRPGPNTLAWFRAHGIVLGTEDETGLARWERAFQRSLYWNHGPNQVWSLQRRWGPVRVDGRLIGIKITPASTAAAAVYRIPAAQRWASNPALQSGGIGSTKARFPA